MQFKITVASLKMIGLAGVEKDVINTRFAASGRIKIVCPITKQMLHSLALML